MTRRWGWTGLVAFATVLGVSLRLPGLDTGLWFDEIVTLVESVRPPLLSVITAFPDSNNHPLYSVLAHLSMAAFGDHVWSLRLPALLFGVASIPVLYVFGQQVTTRIEAALAAVLLAVSYHGVWFSQNARGYTALLFFTLVATGLVLRLLRKPARSVGLAYGLVVGLGIYMHLTMVFIVAGHGLVWLWTVWQSSTSDRGRHLREGLIAGVVAALIAGALYAPALGQVFQFFTKTAPPAAAVATPHWALLEVLRGLKVGFGLIGVFCLLVLAVIGGWSYLRRSPLVTMLFVLPGPITIAATVVLGAPLRPRFFFSLAGFGILILIRGAMEAGRALQRPLGKSSWQPKALGTALASTLTVASLLSVGYNYRHPKQDFEGAMQYIDDNQKPGDVIATGGLATYPYQKYFLKPWTPVERAEDFARLTTSGQRVWVVYSFTVYMDPALVALLKRECPVRQSFEGTLGGGEVLICATAGGTAQ